jgi:hypothetical protein
MLKTLKYILLSITLILALLALTFYLNWHSHSKKEINIFILDKTVRDLNCDNHRSLFEVINNCRITKHDGSDYDYRNDYFGFFPLKPLSKRLYEIKRIILEQIDSLSDEYEALYYADTYGVYFSEWYKGFRASSVNSFIEGGLTQNDFLFIKSMMDKRKLVILEYNTLGSPTSELIKYKTENLLGIHTTGWIGKYVNNLDSSNNNELPNSLISKYFNQNNRKWPFKGPGIVLTNNLNVVVLQKDIHLLSEKPFINSCNFLQERYHLPESTVYLNWFEIVNVEDTNNILANYTLNLTATGDSLIHSYGLSSFFPAIISCHRNGLNMYYFAGDFANNPVSTIDSKVMVIQKSINHIKTDENKLFFQNFYSPLVENILNDYSKSIK